MEIKLNADQLEISKQARRFLEKEAPMDRVREMLNHEHGIYGDLWSGIAELGWLGALVPEEYGGLGMEFMDMAVILHEMGRSLLPGPFFSTAILGAGLIKTLGSHERKAQYLPGVAEGRIKLTLAMQEPDSGGDPYHFIMNAEKGDRGYVVNGVKLFVPDALAADYIIVALRQGPGPENISLFIVEADRDGISMENLPVMDLTRKQCAVTFDNLNLLESDILGEPGMAGQGLKEVMNTVRTGLAAQSVGAAEKAMEMAVDYAKIRVQFDQPIGAFQAVKHLCAQMYEGVESARSLVYWAAWAQDHAAGPDAQIAALCAGTYCAEVFRNVASSAVQVLGGVGFSWESDIHLFLKRAKANEVFLGDHRFNLETIAQGLESGYLGV
jgi:alkylation response protein AidB-like acyl-CoA dehydrogenase